jgi:hypothetical protein
MKSGFAQAPPSSRQIKHLGANANTPRSERPCEICGGPMPGHRRRYCSTRCASRARLGRRRRPRQCKSCSVSVGKGKSFCEACRKLRRQQQSRARVPRLAPSKPCAQCGQPFRSRNPAARYCSRTCLAAAQTRWAGVVVPCESCQAPMRPVTASYHRRRFCSRGCHGRRGRQAQSCQHGITGKCLTCSRGRYRAAHPLPSPMSWCCPGCGQRMIIAWSPRPNPFCSRRCSEREKRRLREHGINFSTLFTLVRHGKTEAEDVRGLAEWWLALRSARRTIHSVTTGRIS